MQQWIRRFCIIILKYIRNWEDVCFGMGQNFIYNYIENSSSVSVCVYSIRLFLMSSESIVNESDGSEPSLEP